MGLGEGRGLHGVHALALMPTIMDTSSITVQPVLQILAAKAVFVGSAACLGSNEKLQGILLVATSALILYWNLRAVSPSCMHGSTCILPSMFDRDRTAPLLLTKPLAFNVRHTH